MDAEFMRKLDDIRALLTEAYEHYFEHSDGHCKSSEGAISIHFPAYFWREGEDNEPAIEVYSYVLGPHRSHYFENIDAALEAVIEWHKREMSFDYSEEGMFSG